MIRELIALDPESRAWIYQADRELTYEELDFIRPKIYDFVNEWSSHGTGVDAYGNIFHKRFIGIFADKSIDVSGCSIDASVHFVREMGNALGIDFFKRTDFAFMRDEKIFVLSQNELADKKESGDIDDETLVFDNLVNTKTKFLTSWLIPLKESWHSRLV